VAVGVLAVPLTVRVVGCAELKAGHLRWQCSAAEEEALRTRDVRKMLGGIGGAHSGGGGGSDAAGAGIGDGWGGGGFGGGGFGSPGGGGGGGGGISGVSLWTPRRWRVLQPQPTTMPPTRTPPRPRSRPTRTTPDGASGGAVGGRLFAWFVRPTGPLKDAVQGCLN
jgi:hypothetical protein